MEGVPKMKKFNEFCEEYEASLWQLCAAIWFFVEYFCNRDVETLFGAGVFWTVLAIFDFIQKKLRKNKK